MLEKSMPNEVQVLLTEVKKFANAARRPNKGGVVCGDGGVPDVVATTTGGQVEVGGMAGDLGQDLATIPAIMVYNKRNGVEYQPESLTQQVVETYITTHGQFQFHTSHHVHGAKITDCGDMHGKMSDADYGTDLGEVQRLIETVQGMARVEKKPGVEETTLGDREHQEKGVLVVQGETHSMIHWVQNGEGQGMFFVLDPARAQERRKVVLVRMGYTSQQVEEIMAIKSQQDLVTNKRLAKGKHVFGVNVDGSNPVVNYLGVVQIDGSIN
jgi:hypothetical protein